MGEIREGGRKMKLDTTIVEVRAVYDDKLDKVVDFERWHIEDVLKKARNINTLTHMDFINIGIKEIYIDGKLAFKKWELYRDKEVI